MVLLVAAMITGAFAGVGAGYYSNRRNRVAVLACIATYLLALYCTWRMSEGELTVASVSLVLAFVTAFVGSGILGLGISRSSDAL